MTGLQTKIQNNKNHLPALLTAAEKMSAAILTEAAATDCPAAFPAETFNSLKENGLLQAVLPQRFGGDGLGIENDSTFELLTLLKILGGGNLVVGRIYEGHFNAVQLIGEYATENQCNRIFSEARQNKHIFGVWNTEAAGGVKIAPLANGKFRLEGAKTFASGAGFVNRPIVTGRLPNGGWQMFLAPMDEIETGIDGSRWQPIGMQSSRSFRVDFSGAEIGAEDLIGQPDDYYLEPFFSGGAIRFAAVQLGAAELLLDLTSKLLCELNRAEDGFQQMRLGEMAIAVESGNLFLAKAARIFDEFLTTKNPARLAETLNYAGMMRTRIEQICQDVMLRAERSIGSRGLMKTYHFERVIRDLTMYLRQAAPDATLVSVGRFVMETETPIGKLWRAKND